MKKIYNVYVFTASTYNYAAAVIKIINADERLIEGFLSREQCIQLKDGRFIKDLKIIKNRDLKDIIIVDNLPHSFGLHLDNGIPILEWLDDKEDRELLKL
jgi:CTD small phosphatase-like protein 2